MPRFSPNLLEPADVRVFIRNAHGHYLSQDDNGLFFTSARELALVFSYRADHVAEQLEAIEKEQRIHLEAEPVPPEEIYERCDRCNEFFMPPMISFDGKHFFCPECRKAVTPRRSNLRGVRSSPAGA